MPVVVVVVVVMVVVVRVVVVASNKTRQNFNSAIPAQHQINNLNNNDGHWAFYLRNAICTLHARANEIKILTTSLVLPLLKAICYSVL